MIVKASLAALAALLGVAAIVAWRKLIRPSALRKRYKRVLDAEPPLAEGRCLGLGREGIVFAVPNPRPENPGLPLAVKILFPDPKHDAEKTLVRQRRKIALLRAIDPRAIPCMMAVIEAGMVGKTNPHVYQLIEAIEGGSVTGAAKGGYFARRGPIKNLGALTELLDTCLALAQADLHAVHADTDNLMVDSDGRIRIVDLDAVYAGPLSETDRLRQLKRLSRSILAIMGESWSGAEFDAIRAEADAFRARLLAHARSEKRSPPPADLAFASLAEMRDALARLREVLQ